MVAVTRLLLEKGASVLAVDCNGMTPALACAPDRNVAECLAIILSMYPSVTLLAQQPNNFQKGEHIEMCALTFQSCCRGVVLIVPLLPCPFIFLAPTEELYIPLTNSVIVIAGFLCALKTV
jgi:hypothetical protein